MAGAGARALQFPNQPLKPPPMDTHAPYTPDYAFEGEPALGTTMQVAPGVHWLRMALPFALNHINLWLLEDGDGWTVVDTGICNDQTKQAWEQIFATVLDGRPVKRAIVTHFHPDHAGLAGWFVERWGAEVWMPLAEWSFGRMLSLDDGSASREMFEAFYKAAGFDEELMAEVPSRLGRYPQAVAPYPPAIRRIENGDVFDVGGHDWRMVVGRGHAPEHACLYCADLKLLISGDQVLPKISPNVSVWPQEPHADPLALFLESMTRIKREVPDDVLVLPSHNWPFHGLHARVDDLLHHHDLRLAETIEHCREPATGVQVLKRLFTRKLDNHQLFFAIGESLAHLHHLVNQGRVERTQGEDGVDLYKAL